MILAAAAIAVATPVCVADTTPAHRGQCHITAETGQTVITYSLPKPVYTLKTIRTAVATPVTTTRTINLGGTPRRFRVVTNTTYNVTYKISTITVRSWELEERRTKLTSNQDLWMPVGAANRFLAGGGWKIA